jgi:paraquat-inducible protein A
MAATPFLLACPDCDLLHQGGTVPAGAMQLCGRCGAVLDRGRPARLDTVLALFLTALILFALANGFPLVSVRLHGSLREASIPGCVRILAALGWPWLAAILLTTVILGPLVHLAGTALVLGQIAVGRQGPWTARLFRLLEEFRVWGMTDVFILGVMVSYAKLAQMTAVRPGPSLFALAGLILAAAMALSALEPRAVWAAAGAGTPPRPVPPGTSARRAGLMACPACGLLAPPGGRAHCSRCGGALSSRKPDSLGRAWALVITSAILWVPANALPVSRVLSLGRPREDTVLGGVQYFLRTGSWPLALLIFVASVVVPLAKIAILTFLLVSVRRRSRWRPRLRATLYRLSDLVGRWAMVDLFAISVMVAVMQMGSLASVEPRPGAMAFTLMVVATMLAVRSFDPRLMWDALEPAHG